MHTVQAQAHRPKRPRCVIRLLHYPVSCVLCIMWRRTWIFYPAPASEMLYPVGYHYGQFFLAPPNHTFPDVATPCNAVAAWGSHSTHDRSTSEPQHYHHQRPPEQCHPFHRKVPPTTRSLSLQVTFVCQTPFITAPIRPFSFPTLVKANWKPAY